ncbi:MAG: MFS transporter [Planctomycetaceae bacterium]|nr:MFS transporter [Planctomycetaceae bacterium]
MHALVDACALLIGPLWPGIERQYGLSLAGLSAAFIVQSLPTNVSQVVFGWLRDRRPMPRFIWIGPLVAAASLPLMGLATHPIVLFVLLAVGGIGVGAFHPEAAVAAGRMLPESRTRAISIFMLGGTLGMTLGPFLSGLVVSRWGMSGLGLLIVPLMVGILALRQVGGLGRMGCREVAAAAGDGSLFDGRFGMAMGLLAICSLRLVPNMAIEKILAYMLEAKGAGVAAIGQMQSLFLGSTALGMMLMAMAYRGGRERAFLIVTPLLSVPLLWILSRPECPEWLFLTALIGFGAILWGTTPAMVAYAQQQFPRGAGFASALTMGFAWGIAGLIQTPITAWYRTEGRPGDALVAFIPCLVASAAGALLLPATRQERSAAGTPSTVLAEEAS